MADNDQSINNLRYNQVTRELEGFGGGSPQWTQLTLTNVDPTQVPASRLISTTAPLMGGGDLSANRTLSIPVATSLANGYLSSADWSTFNSKQAAGSYITALTGDVTAAGPGSSAATLATVNSNVGSFTSANITVDAKGRITAASNGSGATPAGADTQIQYNSSGVFGASASLTFNGTALGIGTNTITAANGAVSFDNGSFISDGAGDVTFSNLNFSNGGASSISIIGGTGAGALAIVNAGNNLLDISTTNNSTVFSDEANGEIVTHSSGALVELQSTTQGLLPSRLTTVQKNAIVSPSTGLVVYDTDLNSLNVYNGTTWVSLGSGGGGSFTPALFANHGGSPFTSSTTFSNTSVTQSFTMADASHRVKVTVATDGYAQNAGISLRLTLAMDGANVGLDLATATSATAFAEVMSTIQWVFSPGDTASHVFSLQYASSNAGQNVVAPNTNGTILIEEII